jgi:Osmosensitive K+ channel histidine kinase
MGNISIKWMAVLLLVTALILAAWVQFVLKETNPDISGVNESKLRLTLSDALGFMKGNWENLGKPEFQAELVEKLKVLNVEATIFDNKTQSVIFVYGDRAKEASKSGAEEEFGLSRQEVAADGSSQLTWLVYRHNMLLGALKIFIRGNGKNSSPVLMNSKTWISGITVFLFLLLIWVCFFLWNLRSGQKLVCSLNLAVKALASGKWDVPIACTGPDEATKESFILLDRTRQDLQDMLLAKEKHEASRKLLMNYLMHDIRTPIASMRALAEGLADGIPRTEEAQKIYYEGILKKITELEKLTNDLFHHVNIEAGVLSIQREEVYCDEAMKPVLLWINSKTFGGNLETDYDIPRVLVKMDTGRMEQALVNLVTNAAKYLKDNGHMKISIKKEDNMVVFSVEDDGIGISKEDLPFIFDHFYRGEKSISRQSGGTGLGLSIVKYIVEAHEGYITVKSKLGEGSTFRIHLPVI